MKIKFFFFTFLMVFTFTACSSFNEYSSILESSGYKIVSSGFYLDPNRENRDEGTLNSNTIQEVSKASVLYLTFEEAIELEATDVVLVQYVASRPFGENLKEFEFIVLDRIAGAAPDTIFVYAELGINTHVIFSHNKVHYDPGVLSFNPRNTYILPLRAINHPLANTHPDGFTFIHNIVINLNQPEDSIMYSESLALHSYSLDLNEADFQSEIIYLLEQLTYNIEPVDSYIRSSDIEIIVTYSPLILVVELIDILRLSSAQRTTDWMATDIFQVKVQETLKGDIQEEFIGFVSFPADTVFLGEQHLVAVRPIEPNSDWFQFSSPYSLFDMSLIEEIRLLLQQ